MVLVYCDEGRLCRILALEQHIFTCAQMAVEFLVVAVQIEVDAVPFGLLHAECFDVAHLVRCVIVVSTELIGLIVATELFHCLN